MLKNYRIYVARVRDGKNIGGKRTVYRTADSLNIGGLTLTEGLGYTGGSDGWGVEATYVVDTLLRDDYLALQFARALGEAFEQECVVLVFPDGQGIFIDIEQKEVANG